METLLLTFVNTVPKKSSRIAFIFDSYENKFPKSYERIRRATDGSIQVHNIRDDTPMPIQTERFWYSSLNKIKLHNYLKTYLLTRKDFDLEIYCGATTGTEHSPCLSRKYCIATVSYTHLTLPTTPYV